MKRLGDELNSAASDQTVRMIVLAANRPAFCVGYDLKEMRARRTVPDRRRSYFTEVMILCSGLMQSIANNPKPVIAEVAGIATAAG